MELTPGGVVGNGLVHSVTHKCVSYKDGYGVDVKNAGIMGFHLCSGIFYAITSF